MSGCLTWTTCCILLYKKKSTNCHPCYCWFVYNLPFKTHCITLLLPTPLSFNRLLYQNYFITYIYDLSVCEFQNQHATSTSSWVDVFCFTSYLISRLLKRRYWDHVQFYLCAPALFYHALNNWSVSSTWISVLTWSVSPNLMTVLMQSQSRQQTRKVIEIHCFWTAVISLQVTKRPAKNLLFF